MSEAIEKNIKKTPHIGCRERRCGSDIGLFTALAGAV